MLLIAVILSAMYNEASKRQDFQIAFRLYRAPLLVIEFLFLIGINIYGWRSSGVNHVLIFELDPRNHLSEQHLMELAAIFGVVWTLSLLSFLYSENMSIPAYISPLTLNLALLLFLLNPLRVFRFEARRWLLKTIFRMISAPFFPVTFADFWLADQLNSLVTALMDSYFFLCFYVVNGNFNMISDSANCMDDSYILRPIVNCLPAWFRFAQCLRRYRDSKEAFPHLVNAGKYSTTFLVVLTATLRSYYSKDYENKFDNPYLYAWMAAAVISTLYALTWDYKMDWGLFDKNAGENTFLREEIVYSSTVSQALTQTFLLPLNSFLHSSSTTLLSWKTESSDLPGQSHLPSQNTVQSAPT